MGDTTITVVAIFLAAILMFVFPLMAMSDRSDNISQLSVQTSTTEFVDNIRKTGKITLANYEKFVEDISSTGNTYEVEMEVQVLDENVSKKATQTQSTKIGENTYYSIYTTQIWEELKEVSQGGKGVYTLKEGDIISVNVKNTNTTMSQTLRNFFYKVTGNDTYQIAAEHAGIVSVNGSK